MLFDEVLDISDSHPCWYCCFLQSFVMDCNLYCVVFAVHVNVCISCFMYMFTNDFDFVVLFSRLPWIWIIKLEFPMFQQVDTEVKPTPVEPVKTERADSKLDWVGDSNFVTRLIGGIKCNCVYNYFETAVAYQIGSWDNLQYKWVLGIRMLLKLLCFLRIQIGNW